MADPARAPNQRPIDPLNPVPLSGADPYTTDSRNPANSQEPRITNRVETRSGGSGVLIAAVVLVLAVIAYFMFAPSNEAVAPADPVVTTEPAPATPAPDATAPAAPAPDATAPAAPADPATPAPDATAPADPAAPAPDSAAPAPAAPAPAPAN